MAKNAIGALRRARSANGWTGQTGRFWKNVRVAKHTRGRAGGKDEHMTWKTRS